MIELEQIFWFILNNPKVFIHPAIVFLRKLKMYLSMKKSWKQRKIASIDEELKIRKSYNKKEYKAKQNSNKKEGDAKLKWIRADKKDELKALKDKDALDEDWARLNIWLVVEGNIINTFFTQNAIA